MPGIMKELSRKYHTFSLPEIKPPPGRIRPAARRDPGREKSRTKCPAATINGVYNNILPFNDSDTFFKRILAAYPAGESVKRYFLPF